MGITGLTSFVNERSHICMEKYDLHDTQLVIDGDSTAYQLYSLYFAPKHCCFSGDYDRYGDLVKLFFRTLFNCNVTPYIVFDGGYEKRKMGTILSRMKDRIRTADKINPTSSDVVFPLFLGEMFKDVVSEFNVKMIRCDFEGDLESARIAKYLNCPILSSDSDFYIFDVLYIPFTSLVLRPIWNLNRSKEETSGKTKCKYIACEIYRIDKFLNFLGLQKDILPLFAVLLGNDYIKRKDFLNLFQHLNSKGHPKPMNSQSMIKSLVSFLKKETTESAIQKVLDSCDQTVRSRIAETINTTINGYIINQSIPSEYLKYLEVETLISELDHNSDIKIKQYVAKTGLSLEIITTFLNNYRSLYPSFFINMLLEDTYHIRPQIEDTTLKNSHMVSLDIISSIHKILKPGAEELKFFARIGTNHEEHLVPPCNISLPTIVNLESMDLNSRQQTLYNILRIDIDFVDGCLNHFPNSWKLYILVIKYLSTKSSIPWSIIYSLILCKIVISYVDIKINEFIRVQDIFYNKFKKTVCDILINKKDNLDLKNTIVSATENILYEDSLIALKNLIPFFQIKSELSNNAKLFDRRLVHFVSQFQSCLYHVKFLNILLKTPFEDCNISHCLNGTFVYNLTTEIRKRPNENYVKFLLQNSATILNCFNLMVICLKKCIITDF